MYYADLGRPEITRDCIWNVYMAMLRRFEGDQRVLDSLTMEGFYDEQIDPLQQQVEAEIDAEVELLDGDGQDYYMGGVNGGLGPEDDDDTDAIRDADAVAGYVDFSDD